MVQVNRRLTKLCFSVHFRSLISKSVISWCCINISHAATLVPRMVLDTYVVCVSFSFRLNGGVYRKSHDEEFSDRAIYVRSVLVLKDILLQFDYNSSRVCVCVVCVCLSVFLRDILKTDGARIAKLDVNMVHYDSWKTIYFGVKRSKVTRHKNIAGMGRECLLLLVLHTFQVCYFYSRYCSGTVVMNICALQIYIR